MFWNAFAITKDNKGQRNVLRIVISFWRKNKNINEWKVSLLYLVRDMHGVVSYHYFVSGNATSRHDRTTFSSWRFKILGFLLKVLIFKSRAIVFFGNGWQHVQIEDWPTLSRGSWNLFNLICWLRCQTEISDFITINRMSIE